MAEFIGPLAEHNKEWGELAMHVGLSAMENPEEVSAACVDFLMYSGYVTYAYFWARAAKVALASTNDSDPIYSSKVKSAQFYFQRILPRVKGLAVSVKSGAGNLQNMDLDEF